MGHWSQYFQLVNHITPACRRVKKMICCTQYGQSLYEIISIYFFFIGISFSIWYLLFVCLFHPDEWTVYAFGCDRLEDDFKWKKNRQSGSCQCTQPHRFRTESIKKIWEKNKDYKIPTKTKEHDEKEEVNRMDTLKINRYILYFCVFL